LSFTFQRDTPHGIPQRGFRPCCFCSACFYWAVIPGRFCSAEVESQQFTIIIFIIKSHASFLNSVVPILSPGSRASRSGAVDGSCRAKSSRAGTEVAEGDQQSVFGLRTVLRRLAARRLSFRACLPKPNLQRLSIPRCCFCLGQAPSLVLQTFAA
jgi:hypothetical protein